MNSLTNVESLRHIQENGLVKFTETVKSFKFNKKHIQAGVVAVSLVAVSTFAGLSSQDEMVKAEATDATATVSEAEVTVVSADEAEAEVELTAEEALWADKLMANVEDYLTVRAATDAESAAVGKLRKGDLAVITETLDGWYHITSGNVDGYVSAEFCVIGMDAKALSEVVCKTYVTSTTGGLRVRETASEDAAVVSSMGEGDRLELNKDAEAFDGWVAVKTKKSSGYVNASYVTVATEYGSGITAEEEAAAIQAAKEAAAAAAAKAAQTTATTTVQNAPVAASYDDETLLAALIQKEAGQGTYEGMVAVGAVVMNRVRSGGYPSSIEGVINQRGQFGGGVSSLSGILSSGPSASCRQAAQEALAGTDNTGGCLQFRSARSGCAGTVIGGNVFF